VCVCACWCLFGEREVSAVCLCVCVFVSVSLRVCLCVCLCVLSLAGKNALRCARIREDSESAGLSRWPLEVRCNEPLAEWLGVAAFHAPVSRHRIAHQVVGRARLHWYA